MAEQTHKTDPSLMSNQEIAVAVRSLVPPVNGATRVLHIAAERIMWMHREREALQSRIDELIQSEKQRDAAHMKGWTVSELQRAAMAGERDEAVAKLATMTKERDEARIERDAVTKERDKARCQLDAIRNNAGLMRGTPVEELIECVGELATFRENARNRDCEGERLARVQKELAYARAELARLRYSVAVSVGNTDRHDMFAAAALTGLLADSHNRNSVKENTDAARHYADAMVAPRDIEDAPHATDDVKPTREELLDALDNIAREWHCGRHDSWRAANTERDANGLNMLVAVGRWESSIAESGTRYFRPIPQEAK